MFLSIINLFYIILYYYKINYMDQNQLKQQNQLKPLSFESVIISHVIVTTILVLYIVIPLLNSLSINDVGLDLLNQQYTINFYKTIIVTFFINYIYLKFADLLPGKIPVVYKRIITIIIVSVLLNYYINCTPMETGTIKFMKTWIKSVGWFAIVWDLINTSLIGIVADKVNNLDLNLHQTNVRNMLIFIIFTFAFLHI